MPLLPPLAPNPPPNIDVMHYPFSISAGKLGGILEDYFAAAALAAASSAAAKGAKPVEGGVSHLTPHTSHLTPHTSHLTPHTSHLTPHTSHPTHHTSHLTPHTSHLTSHTSPAPYRTHITRPQTPSRFLCDVGPSFSNPASAIISLLLSSRPTSPFRSRVSIETALAHLLHTHISSAVSSGDDDSRQKIAKILNLLKPTSATTGVSFDSISWHRLLVSSQLLQNYNPNPQSNFKVETSKPPRSNSNLKPQTSNSQHTFTRQQCYLAAALSVPIFLWVPIRSNSGGSASQKTQGNVTMAPYFYPAKK
jgi:hypothetical protein